MTERIICKEMLEARHYIAEDISVVIEDLQCEFWLEPGDDKRCLVIFLYGQPLEKKVFIPMLEICQNNSSKHLIIVLNSKVTPCVNKNIRNMHTFKVEIFNFKKGQLSFNITKHRLVPKHEKLTLEEMREFKRLKINLGSLPILKKTDPVALFYAFDAGDIIKITHKNESVSYRIVR